MLFENIATYNILIGEREEEDNIRTTPKISNK